MSEARDKKKLKEKVKRIQRACNEFTNHWLEDVTPLVVDGDLGHATIARIKLVKFYAGYVKSKRGPGVGESFFRRIAKPRNTKRNPKSAVKRGIRRRKKQRRLAKQARDWRHKKGFGVFEGKTVAAWMIPWFEKSKAHRCKKHPHGWTGTIASGVRTAAYSEHLCFGICGAPSCPGRCAGRSSNHNMEENAGYPSGAADVTMYAQFAEIQREIGSPLKNDLPNDLVHFSVTGH